MHDLISDKRYNSNFNNIFQNLLRFLNYLFLRLTIYLKIGNEGDVTKQNNKQLRNIYFAQLNVCLLVIQNNSKTKLQVFKYFFLIKLNINLSLYLSINLSIYLSILIKKYLQNQLSRESSVKYREKRGPLNQQQPQFLVSKQNNKQNQPVEMDMQNKIQEILSFHLRHYTNDEQQDIIQRLALIGLRTLQLEQKEAVQVDQINRISNQIFEKMDETGNLRKELSNIKEQLNKLSNKFETLSSEKKQNTEPSFNCNNLSSISASSILKPTNSIPPQPPSTRQNALPSKDNRSNQFLSQQRLQSLPNQSNNNSNIVKTLNTPQQNQKQQINFQTSPGSQHKLFETDQNSLFTAKNMTKKPSSAWRNGERSNSLNQQSSQNNEQVRSNSEEASSLVLQGFNDSESQDIQKRKFIKNHEQIAPKITETIPSTIKYDSVKTTTRHHLDDKHIKDALFCMKEEPRVQNAENLNQLSKQRKKWDSGQQELQKSEQAEPFKNEIHEYVSLSSHQQFLPTQIQQSQQPQTQNFNSVGSNINIAAQYQNSHQKSNNANFTSPKFKDGRENSINTQYNTTDQKKNGFSQNSNQTIAIMNQPPNTNQYSSQPPQQQQQIQQKKVNSNQGSQKEQPQIQQQQQTKYATTKSLQKKVEINKQKKMEESKKQTQKKQQQPTYLKNVTSKIKDEIRLQKESLKGGFNHDVQFVIKEKGAMNMQGNKSQTRVVNGSELEEDEMRPYYKHDLQFNQGGQAYNDYIYQQQYNQQTYQQKISKGNELYSNLDEPNNVEENNNNSDDEDSSYQINNYNLRRNQHKLLKQNSSNQYQNIEYQGKEISEEIPPVPMIDESYSEFKNICSQSQNQQKYYQFQNEMIEDQYSNFDQKSSYTPTNYQEAMRNNNFNENKQNYNDENFNYMNMPNNPHDKSTNSNYGEQNSFNYRYNDQSSIYSNNNAKGNYEQYSNNINNTTSNSQNLSAIANNMLHSPIINHFSNLKPNKKETCISDQDIIQPASKKYSQSKPMFSDQSTYPYSNNGQNQLNQNGFDQLNDSYQNSSYLQQSANDISYKKTLMNPPPYQKNLSDNLDQSSMAQDNYDQQNRSINSSLSSFKLDNNMKEVLQKDRLFFQKMFEGEDQFSQQKFDNTFTSYHQSNNNYGNILNSKSQTKQQIGDYIHNSSNNKMKDDSVIDHNLRNPSHYSQIQQKMDYNQSANDYQFGDEDINNGSTMMDKRLCNFFAEQS
ncbi:transmembrane protein, putative (macronuclear) [Tetrahymena thermophila SB210]|uniref:Transmembrane protein, putative n=1 Tax=Tetrahymena thermophila (strain SB210) TaxID=312017 RepID=Q24CZ9_TETTS|nr:transmembrane protein, putative [Tetrahymena thermophila SB210]EAS05609.2 transmembrane protein, putative [Tetrahymena thermophila SB210]|eukprot:XP_001025854.2 transmembrane protein, putative [Tetrahymena thermophila SB210]